MPPEAPGSTESRREAYPVRDVADALRAVTRYRLAGCALILASAALVVAALAWLLERLG